MTQGLRMFDAEHRLLGWTRRDLDIFGLPEDALRIGMSQRDVNDGEGRQRPAAA